MKDTVSDVDDGSKPKSVMMNKDNNARLWYQRRNDVLKRLKQLSIRGTDHSVSKDRSFFNSTRKMKKSRCYICFVRGHAYWNCPNKHRKVNFKKTGTKNRNLDDMEIKHKATKTVFNEPIIPTPNWLVLGSDARGWDEIWYISDEFPRHMTPNIDMFDRFKPGSMSTSSASQQGLKVLGFGEVTITTEVRTYVVPGVYYVPNCGLNMLSLSQLIIQGFRVRIRDSKAIVERAFEEEYEDDDSSDELDYEESSETVEDTGMMSENGSEKDLKTLDSHKQTAIEAIKRYYDCFSRGCTLEERLNGKQDDEVPTKNDFDSFVGFMQMIREQEILEGCKDLVKKHFEKLVKWFYKEYMKLEPVPIPMKINSTEICLLDLYLTVKGMGGYSKVLKENKWRCVAKGMGFPIGCADDIKDCYMSCLSLLGIYYYVARCYSSRDFASRAMECMNAKEGVASVLPKEDAILGCVEPGVTKMELDKVDDRMGNIEFDDGETLIITFEEHQEGNSKETLEEAQSSSSKVEMDIGDQG